MLQTYTAGAQPRGWTAKGQPKVVSPAGGFKELRRRELVLPPGSSGYGVALESAEGRLRDYRVISRGDRRERVREEELEGGERLRTREVSRSDGVTASERADGTVITSWEGPDPAWGSRGSAPQRREIRTPSGLIRSVEVERGATLADADDPLSVESRTSTVTLNGRIFQRLYDGASRQTTWTTPEGRSVVTVTDALGRVVESRTGDLAPLAVSYGAAGRLAALTQGTGAETRTVTFGYNAAGRLAQVTDPLSRSVSFTYDALGRVTAQTLADGRALGFSSDANGNLTALAPPERPAHGFAYTPVDLQQEYTPPAVAAGTDRTRFVHDLDRRLTRIERPDGSAVELAYDAAGRLTAIDAPEGVTGIAYRPGTRDPAVLTAPDGGTLTYTYDGFLLTGATWSGEVAGTVERTYDADFRVAERTVNGGHPVAFAYDRDGLLVNAGGLTLHRDPANGLVTGTTLGQVTTETSHNPFGEPVAESAAFAGSPLLEVASTRDALGRITGKTETVGGVTDTYAYTYDLAGRLTEVEKNGASFAEYTYDANGNRLSYDGTFGRFTGTYDAQDRLLTYGDALDPTVYTYTASGELSGKSAGGQTVTYDYGALGDLLGVTLASGLRIDYVVDARNRRIGKKIDGTLVQGFLYKDRLNPVAELDGAGNVVARFVYGTKANVPDLMVKGRATYRLLSGPLGSVRLVVDAATGTVAQRLDYDEFGRVLLDTHPGFQPFAFAGGLYDPQTGLTRFGARDYDPEVGRWTAKDPILFKGRDTNLYGYAFNDPLNLSDPLGLRCVNNSPAPVVVKPEDTDDEIFELSPGEIYEGDIDGVKPPAWRGDWYKVSTGTDVTINPDGSPTSSGGPAWVPEVPDWGGVFDSFPGRKREPAWSERHPDWRYDPERWPEDDGDCNCQEGAGGL